MQIKKIHIQNFKSLVDFKLDNPKSFCAFVGPNASGKSNIFEALEFVNYVVNYSFNAPSFFGGIENIMSFGFKRIDESDHFVDMRFNCSFLDNIRIGFDLHFSRKIGEFYTIDAINPENFSELEPNRSPRILDLKDAKTKNDFIKKWKSQGKKYDNNYEIFIDNFSRIFVGKPELVRINSESKKLKADASNLAQIIGQIFQDETKKEDFIDWLRILVPEFENILVKQSNIDGGYDFCL